MRFTRFLTKEEKKMLEFEIVPQDLMIYLTRLLRSKIGEWTNEDAPSIIWENMIINLSHNLLEMPIYVLEADADGSYFVQEQIWHEGEINLALRRLNTIQFIELMCELVERSWFTGQEINPIFEEANLSFRIKEKNPYVQGIKEVQVEILSVQDIEEQSDPDEHPNIRLLVNRMEILLEANDTSGVLHTSATIFETLAKDILSTPNIENQTLGGFFDKYRKNSNLPAPVLDYILSIYNSRSSTPLAGHGKTTAPTLSKQEAITIAEITKAFVKIEYQLRREALQLKPSSQTT